MVLIRILLITLISTLVTSADSLKIGVTPYTNAMKIIKVYEPLTKYLSNELKVNVEVYSSNNYKNFYEDVEKGTFDLVITSPHFGVLHLQNGFHPIYRYNTSLTLLFLVLKQSPYKKVSDLKNTTIATPNHLSALNIASVKTLLDNGLKNGESFTLEDLGSHTSAIKSVLLGDCDAAITTYSPVKQFSDKSLLEKTRLIKSDFKMPHLFTLANPKYDSKKIEEFKALLHQFEQTDEGKKFFEKTGYKGYIDISTKDISELEPVSQVTKKYLGIE